MDFPNDTNTNVFSAGDIKEVHWAFYTKRPNHASNLHNRSSGEDEGNIAHTLHSAEYTLREDGYHTVVDDEEAGLWLFSLSQAPKESIALSLGLDGLESTSAGVVLSRDLFTASSSHASAPLLIKPVRSTLSTVAAIGEMNTQVYRSNASPNTQLMVNELDSKRLEVSGVSHNHSVSRVYSNFVSAASCSLSYALGKRQGWIQLGPHACIDARTLGYDPVDHPDSHAWVATTSRLSFDVKWLSCGTLLISVFQTRLPKHSRVSTVLSEGVNHAGLALGSPVVFSPFGIRGQYLGTEDPPKSNPQRKATIQLKASVLSRLAYRGIRVIQDATWIQVHVEQGSNAFSDPLVSLWPADLCFCEDTMVSLSGEDLESSNRSIVDCSIDPLEQAESWFRGKAARREALQDRLREESQRAQVAHDIEDTDDEEGLSPLEIPLDQGITPQDVSGIYPTPPDGPPQPLSGLSNPHNLHSGDYVNEEKDLRPSDEARGDYDAQENDDLFGDMDIDMFASNGLTEADFRFFDEPGMMDEDMRDTGQVMTLDETNETADHPMLSDENVLAITPHERRDSRPDQKLAELQEVDTGDQENIRTSRTTRNSMSDKDLDKALKSTLKVEDVDYGALERLNLHHKTGPPDAHGGQRGSFEHVPFQTSRFNLDDKYNMQGRFAFDVDELPVHCRDGERLSNDECHLLKLSLYPESPREDSVNTSDEEEDAPAREDSDSPDAVGSSLELQAVPSRKRKREQLDEDDHPMSPSSPVPHAESTADSPHNNLDEPAPDLSEPNALEKTKDVLNLELRANGRSISSFTGGGQAFIEVAQLVAHQAVSGVLESQTEYSEEIKLMGESIDRSLENTLTPLLSQFFPTNKRCSLKDYVGLGEKNPANVPREQVTSNQRNFKPTHMAGGTAVGHSIFKIDSPHTRVQRHGVSTEISVPALSFWEELSLGPSYEHKDINVFCVCPNNKYIEEGVMSFLNMVKGTYQSCNLGSHDLGGSPANHGKRIRTVPIDASKPDELLQNIGATCERLGIELPELGLQHSTNVIYIINPFNNQQYLPGLYDALSRLPNACHSVLEKRRPDRHYDLVMQIVPLGLVWSPERIVVPSPADYRRLAFEVYDKCRASGSDPNRELYFMTAPAIRLAKAMPKTIDFKLVSESSAPFIQSDNCVHVSYSWDATNEWLAACWTDNLGVLSWRACYCLGKNEETPLRPIYETIREVLETSFDMLYPPNAPWRLFVCKDGPITKMEYDVWLRALADSSRPSTSCTILTVDTQSTLTLSYSDLQKTSSDLAPAVLATPEATPHTNAPSPDIPGLGSTPAASTAQIGTPPAGAPFGDHDSEARLIDLTDETWGVVMDGTIHDPLFRSDDINLSAPPLASGYLIKRAGPRDADGLIPLAVAIVHNVHKPHKPLLREVLRMYRNLATLARVRGVVHPVKSVLPLHVAVAKRARKALCESMGYRPE